MQIAINMFKISAEKQYKNKKNERQLAVNYNSNQSKPVIPQQFICQMFV